MQIVIGAVYVVDVRWYSGAVLWASPLATLKPFFKLPCSPVTPSAGACPSMISRVSKNHSPAVVLFKNQLVGPLT